MMQSISSTEYTKSLDLVRRGIDSPTVDDLLAVCPHLSENVVRAAFNRVVSSTERYPSWYFGVPGLLVQGAHHKASLIRYPDAGLKLVAHFAGNQLASDGGTAPEEAAACIAWQRANLAFSDLISPVNEDGSRRWGWFEGNSVRDPSRRWPDYVAPDAERPKEPARVEQGLTPGCPYLVTALTMVFRVGMGPNERQTHHRWREHEADCDLMIHGDDALLWAEVKGANRSISGFMVNWCGLCGRSMHMTGCGPCNYRYRDNQFDTGGGPPIGPKAQALVESRGWAFAHDPALARAEADARMVGTER